MALAPGTLAVQPQATLKYTHGCTGTLASEGIATPASLAVAVEVPLADHVVNRRPHSRDAEHYRDWNHPRCQGVLEGCDLVRLQGRAEHNRWVPWLLQATYTQRDARCRR